MYNEVNGFELYQDFFYFPLEQGNNIIVVSCAEWGILYPENNSSNSIECLGGEYDIQFNIDTSIESSSTQLVLEWTTGPTSFGEISIFLENSTNSWSIITESSIFSSIENMQQFYIYEFAFIIVFLILIFLKKFFNKLW